MRRPLFTFQIAGSAGVASRRTDYHRGANDSVHLDGTGSKLKSGTRVKFGSGKPLRIRDFIFDRPFLLALCRREAREPFFLLWVDDAAMMSGGKDL